jgi:tripartite-type tricarboxylate transporter receptor subunit TctC
MYRLRVLASWLIVTGYERASLRTVATLLLALCVNHGVYVCAQDYPSKVIRIVLPFPPSGATDVYARLVARELQAAWGHNVVVENRPGATGLIGTELARRAPPDGYTLLFTSNSAHVLGPLPREPRPFDPATDFAAVTKVLKYPVYLLVHPSLPVRTLKEFAAFARARPGQLTFSSSGQAGVSHVVAELFNEAAGIKAVHASYKGSPPAVQAVVAGECQYLFNNVGVSQPLVRAGRLRGLAVTGDKRVPVLPDVPTMSEMGVPGMGDTYTWLGLFAPLNTPAAIVNKLNAEVVRIMRTPEMDKRVYNDGYLSVANTPAQFRSEMQTEVATWSKIIQSRGIKAE